MRRCTVMTMPFLLLLAACCALLLPSRAGAASDVDVAAFGAKPDDGKDDTRAVQAAIEACRRETGSRLLFSTGRYDFFAGQNPRSKRNSLLFNGCKDLAIDGRGATLIFHGLTAPFWFSECEDVMIGDLVIDWNRPLFSQGRVLASTRRDFDIEIEKAFPVSGGEAVEAFGEYDARAGRPLRRGLDIYRLVESTTLVRPQVLKVRLTRPLSRPLAPGTTLVLRHQVYSYNAFSFRECRNVTLRDVTVYTAPGMGVHASGGGDFVLERFRVMVRRGSGRLMSSTADATHFNSCAGTIVIEDCVFEGMGDDAVNVHGMFLVVRERADVRTVVAVPGRRWAYNPTPGDRIELTRAATLLPYAEAVVKWATHDRKAQTFRIEFTAPLPKELAVGDVLGNATRSPRLRITGCTVGNNRARGFLVQTRDALIEKNTFRYCSGAGIHVTCDADYWFESIGTRRVVVRGNTFEGCNYGAAMAEGVIRVFAHVKGRRYAPPGVHRDITIENNTVRNTANAAIFVGSTDGVVIRNNRIERCSRDPSRRAGRSAIYLLNTRDATITGNRLVRGPAGAGPAQPLVIGAGCDKETIEVEDNAGF